MRALDLSILLAYLTGVTLQGLWLGRGNRSARDYFLSNRTIPGWAVVTIGGALLFREGGTPAVAVAAMARGLGAMALVVPLAHLGWTWFVPLGTLLAVAAGWASARVTLGLGRPA